MRCEEITERHADYLAGSLSDTERAAVQRHGAGCAACQKETEHLGGIWSALQDIPAPEPDSRAMRARLDATIARAQASTRPARGFQWNYALAASVAAVALIGGVFIGRSGTPAVPSTDVTALRDEVRDLRHMVALSLLQQQSASERLKGVSWSGRLEGPSDEIVTALLDTLMHDENVNVRLASIDALKRFAERDDVRRAAVDALQKPNSPLVQMALIDFVVETQDRSAAGALRQLSGVAEDQTVRTRAAWGLEHLGVKS
jgi:HEAT repeat protein/putative zinc finger protein